MFTAKTVSLSNTSATEITAGINVDQDLILLLRNTNSANASIRIGDANVTSGSGFTLDTQQQEVTVTVCGDKVYAIATSSNGGSVDVLAYSG